MSVDQVFTGQTTRNHASRIVNALLLVVFLLFLAVQVRRAWLSDDAFITFRTVDNFLNGYGLVWNLGERVQTYTHPLWMFVLSAVSLFTHELVFTSLLLSIVLSMAAILLLVTKISVSRLSALFVVTALILSNAFVDYSTSGLENPLSHLLLAIYFTIYFTQKTSAKKIFWLSLATSFGAVNRLDLLLIFAPPLLYEVYKERSVKGILFLIIGQLPFVLWEIFSIIYYGFLFPNTAYAKLNTGIPSLDLVIQGLAYIIDSLRMDPITLAIIGSGIVLALLSKEKRNIPIAIGILIYLFYVIKIGGDFMSSRFLSAPFFCSLIVIARFNLTSLPALQTGLIFSTALVLGLISPTPTIHFWEADLTAKQRSVMVNDRKVSNERQYYGWSNGLLRIDRQSGVPVHQYAQDGLRARQSDTRVIRRITVGMFGYYAGPQIYVVDELALGDALLARLPAERDDQWRIGHFQRTMPDGYVETLRSGQNQLKDDNLAKFYDQLILITQGELLAPGRVATIWKMNTGQYNSLIDFDTYRFPKLVHNDLNHVSQTRPTGVAWDAPGNIRFRDSGIEIDLIGLVNAQQIEFNLDGNNNYLVEYRKDGQVVAQQKLEMNTPKSTLQIVCLETSQQAITAGFDAIRIFAVQGDGDYSLGHLRLNQCSEP